MNSGLTLETAAKTWNSAAPLPASTRYTLAVRRDGLLSRMIPPQDNAARLP